MIDAETNRVGAMVIALGDRLRAATEEAADMPASYPAALSALGSWAGGRPVEVLADGLRLSHSRAVRVVDRLEEDGRIRLTVPRDVLVPLVLNTVLGFGLYYVVTRDDESCVRALSAFRQLAGSMIEPVE